jgi:hypothetical protein
MGIPVPIVLPVSAQNGGMRMSNRDDRSLLQDAVLVIACAVLAFVIGMFICEKVAGADSVWVAVSVDSSRTYGDPRCEFIADSTGVLYVRAVWFVDAGTWQLVQFREDRSVHPWGEPFTLPRADSVLVEFPVMDSTGMLYVGASLRAVE